MIDTLSPVEKEVLVMFSNDFSQGEIAAMTRRSPETIKAHARHIREKTECRTMGGAIALALREGWIE